MRILLTLLILAIGFNGYSAVAHTLAEDMGSIELASDYQLQKVEKSSDHASDSTSCVDCTHCCMAQVFTISGYSIKYGSPLNTWLSPLNETHPERSSTSLFRPPITLI